MNIQADLQPEWQMRCPVYKSFPGLKGEGEVDINRSSLLCLPTLTPPIPPLPFDLNRIRLTDFTETQHDAILIQFFPRTIYLGETIFSGDWYEM